MSAIHYLFKGDVAAAATHLTQAARQPGAPGYVARFAAILQTKRQGPQTTIAILEQMRGIRSVNRVTDRRPVAA
jgi:hypothetical protein